MSRFDRVVRMVTHPATVGFTGVLTLLGIYKGGLVWAVLVTAWANAGSFFGIGSITLFVGEQVGLPEWAVQVAVVLTIVFGVAAIAKGIGRFLDGVEARTK